MKVKITLLEEVLGSSPSNEELLATYIASKAPTGDLTAEEVDNIKAQNAEDRITVFPKTSDGTPFLYDYQVKGMFKDSCKMLAKAGKAGYAGGKACAAIKAYKQAIDGLIFVTPREIPYDLHGMKVDFCERPLRAQTPMGERVSMQSRRAFPQVQQQNLKSNVSTLSLRIWFVNASTTAQSAALGSGETAARAALNGRKSKNDDRNKNAAPVHHHRNGKKTEHRKKL